MKNIQKIIENIVTKEPNPDPKYAPHVVLRWYTKTEGQIYHDLSTGKRLTSQSAGKCGCVGGRES